MVKPELKPLFNLIYLLFLFKHLFYSDRKAQVETNVDKLKLKIKNEIDLRVDIVKEQLDKMRKELFNDVDRICENALK